MQKTWLSNPDGRENPFFCNPLGLPKPSGLTKKRFGMTAGIAIAKIKIAIRF